mmetsp:Transcript_35090/g.87948  ORF Transcript_35090/g.87948 Transcript_35090/m.87948 type:complete len:314 (+) Transcript_35090:906-1847(+)
MPHSPPETDAVATPVSTSPPTPPAILCSGVRGPRGTATRPALTMTGGGVGTLRKGAVLVAPARACGPASCWRIAGGGQGSQGRPGWPRRGSRFAAARSASRSTPEKLKAEVLQLVSQQGRGGPEAADAKRRLLDAVEALEAEGGGVSAPLAGRWALVYSTQQAERETISWQDNQLLQAATNRLYKTFFRFAPALAGSQETGARGVANEQLIDLQAGRVDNVVEVAVPGWMGDPLRIRVWGEVEAVPGNQGDLIVTFTGWSLRRASERGGAAALELPLPRPRGSLRTAFCDGSMRISRGGRGGLFITTRLPPKA